LDYCIVPRLLLTGASKPRGNDAFCVIGNVGELKDAATRCVLRPEMLQNAFATGAPPQIPLGSLQRSPDPLAGFGRRIELEMETTRDGKRTEGKERKGRQMEKGRIMEFRGDLGRGIWRRNGRGYRLKGNGRIREGKEGKGKGEGEGNGIGDFFIGFRGDRRPYFSALICAFIAIIVIIVLIIIVITTVVSHFLDMLISSHEDLSTCVHRKSHIVNPKHRQSLSKFCII